MRIAVLGTGMVGRAFASRLTELGHEVTIGTRDVAATMARTDPDQMGNAPFPQWAAENTLGHAGHFRRRRRAGRADCERHRGSRFARRAGGGGRRQPRRQGVLDIANPLDHSAGMPPTLLVKDTDSLGEQIQRAFPEARVVKALNTMNAYLMVDPRQLAGGDHSAFVSGNDPDAKKTVTDATGVVRPHRHHRPRRHHHRPRHRDDPAGLDPAVGRSGHPDVQLQDRPLSSADSHG